MPAQMALREQLYNRLSNPAITYRLKGGTVTLLPLQVIPRPIWLAEEVPPISYPPYVAFTVTGRGGVGRVLGERYLAVKIWCVSTDGPDECTELYEVVRSRIHLADQNTVPNGPADLSAAATATTYGIAVRQLVEVRVSDVDYSSDTHRWSLIAEYDAAAI